MSHLSRTRRGNNADHRGHPLHGASIPALDDWFSVSPNVGSVGRRARTAVLLDELRQTPDDLPIDVLERLFKHLRDWSIANVAQLVQADEGIALGFDSEVWFDRVLGRELEGSDRIAGPNDSRLELSAHSAGAVGRRQVRLRPQRLGGRQKQSSMFVRVVEASQDR